MMRVKLTITILFVAVVTIVTVVESMIRQLNYVQQPRGVIFGGPSGPSGEFVPVFATSTASFPLPESSAEALPLPESSAEPLTVDREKYLPSRYGIPGTLGGLQVAAVISHETNPCSPEDFMHVMLQGPDATMDDYLQNDTTQQRVNTAMKELQAIYPNGFVSVSGPVQDMDALFMRLEENYLAGLQAITNGGCVTLGGPLPQNRMVVTEVFPQASLFLPESSAEPLSVDREKYSPARYGIPETLGGFEVLAVITREYNPCLPEDAMHVTLQGVDATFEEYQEGSTPTNVDKALDELHLLYPNATLSFGGPVEDEDAFFRQLEENRVMAHQAVAAEGCEPLGGPFIPDPNHLITKEADISQPIQEIATATPMR